MADPCQGGFYFTDPGYMQIKNPIGKLHYVDRSGNVLVVAAKNGYSTGIAFDAERQRLVVVRSTVEEIATGWIVDRLIGIRRQAMDDMQPSSTRTIGAAERFLNGIVDCEGQLIAVLDVNRVLSSPETRQFEPTWQADVA